MRLFPYMQECVVWCIAIYYTAAKQGILESVFVDVGKVARKAEVLSSKPAAVALFFRKKELLYSVWD